MNKMLLEPRFTLRDTLTLKYYISSNYRTILPYSDLPSFFDYQKKPWRLRVCSLSGFYYSRIHRNYTLWLNNGLKRKIGLYMPLIMKAPIRRNKPTDPWYRRSSLYLDSYYKINNNWLNPKYFELSLNSFNIYKLTSSSIYDNLAKSRENRHILPCNYFGLDHDLFISSYNYNWHNIYDADANFYKFGGRGPDSFLIGVNSFLMHVGLNINLFDTTLMLLPEPYWTYLQNKKNFKILNYNNFFFLPYNNFYKKIIVSLYDFFHNIVIMKLNKYKDIFILNNSILNLYKILLFNIYTVYIKKNFKKQKFFSFLIKKFIFNLKFLKIFFYKKNSFKTLLNNIFIILYNKFNKYFCFLYDNKCLNNIFYDSELIKKQKYLFNFSKYICPDKEYTFIQKKNTKKGNAAFFINIYNKISNYQYNVYNYNKKVASDYIFSLKKKKIDKNLLSFKFSNFNFSKIKLNNFEKLDILSVTNYGKYFLGVPEKLYQNLNYTKASSLLYNVYNFKSFFFKNSKDYWTNLTNFNSNFFYLISLLIKLNFGFSFSLFSLYTKDYTNELSNILFINIEYFILKYFLFMNKYINILNKKKKNKLNSSFKLMLLNITNINNINIINKLLKINNKYFDFCILTSKFKKLNILKKKVLLKKVYKK